MTAITGHQIDLYRLLALRQALKLELLGMTARGRTAYSTLKRDYGFKGSRQSVLEQLNALRDQFLNKGQA